MTTPTPAADSGLFTPGIRCVACGHQFTGTPETVTRAYLTHPCNPTHTTRKGYSMNKRTTLTLAALAVTTITAGCELQPGQPEFIRVSELEAPWVQVTPPTQLWVDMVTVGDWPGRCVTNLGGVQFNDSRGHVCEIGPRPATPDTTVVPIP